MEFINQAVTVLQTLVVALGAGLAVWGVVNLMEGYGADNPASKSQGVLDRLSAPLELAHVDIQHLLLTEHAPQTKRHAEDLADNGRERRAANTHLRERADAEDHQRVKDDVDDRTGQALTHRDDHVAAGLLDLLAHHRDHNKNTHADRKVRILDSVSRNRLARTECADEYTRKSPTEDEECDAANNRQRNAVLCRRVRVLLALRCLRGLPRQVRLPD